MLLDVLHVQLWHGTRHPAGHGTVSLNLKPPPTRLTPHS